VRLLLGVVVLGGGWGRDRSRDWCERTATASSCMIDTWLEKQRRVKEG
jgi:hypothetical protein